MKTQQTHDGSRLYAVWLHNAANGRSYRSDHPPFTARSRAEADQKAQELGGLIGFAVAYARRPAEIRALVDDPLSSPTPTPKDPS